MHGLSIRTSRWLCHRAGGLAGWSITATPATLPSSNRSVYPYHGAAGQSLSGFTWLGFGSFTSPCGPYAVSLPSPRVRTQKPLNAQRESVRSCSGVSV
jgi:hypothetical protein